MFQAAGFENALGSNHWIPTPGTGVFGYDTEPVQLGRGEKISPVPDSSLPRIFSGKPPCQLIMGLMAQLPTTAFTAGRQVTSKLFSPAKRQIVNGIGGQDMFRIPVALCVIAVGIEDVLPVAVGILRLTAPASVVAGAVGHTLLVSVGDLSFQAVAGPFRSTACRAL